MARWSTTVPTWTPTAVGDGANIIDGAHHTIQGGSSTQRGELREIYVGGQAGASTPTFNFVGRTSQVGTGSLTAARNAAIDPSTAALALPPLPYTGAATNKPQRSSTLGMLVNLCYNAFGGIVRWYMGPDETVSYLGNTASLGELSLSAFTGGTPGLQGTTIIFETL